MNANLRRVTFVLSRESAEAIRYISERTGSSQSEFVRGVLSGPVVQIADLLRAVPDTPDPAQRDLFLVQVESLLRGEMEETFGTGASNE